MRGENKSQTMPIFVHAVPEKIVKMLGNPPKETKNTPKGGNMNCKTSDNYRQADTGSLT